MASTRKRLEALTAGLSIPEPAPAAAPASNSTAPVPTTLPGAAAAVETRFPPAQTSQFAPRTGPGQMLAFRGQMQAVEGELTALRERLHQHDGSTPTRKLDPATIRASRWANRHPASFENAEFAGLKADVEQAGGNVQPILVRPVADEPGQYELVFGHRRHRACLELGIPVLAAIWLDELGDAELFAAMDRENRERADLSPYEQGVMYQRALEEQLFPTQRQLAEKLGVSHTWIRKALMVAQLPSAVLECFRSPLEVQHRHAEQLNAALDKDRRSVLKRAEKVRGQKLAPAAVVARLLGLEAAAKPEKLALLNEGKTVGSCLRAPDGAVTLTLLPGPVSDLPTDVLLKCVAEALQKVKLLG
ncbi:chromosome partitioning protein, ParB family [Variovorax sp. YR752]|uniref:ParB/RepB/Spo0J family partition protein n=1 Tax=Variovorax sp. YR752 TaxID=1884383 RepID=UPI000BCA6366|nr:ParB/RepB/Spo0J family partition protein [Variovorax sp. YR752]SOE06214.1 chromosome partitioning protein, ParB family [Variovorax sp. YR752]